MRAKGGWGGPLQLLEIESFPDSVKTQGHNFSFGKTAVHSTTSLSGQTKSHSEQVEIPHSNFRRQNYENSPNTRSWTRGPRASRLLSAGGRANLVEP